MNIEEFKVGDIVEATNGDNKVRGEIKSTAYGNDYLDAAGLRVNIWMMTEQGWTLTLVKAAPAPLPTVPGIYTSRTGAAWQVDGHGVLGYLSGYPIEQEELDNISRDAANYAPFTLLTPPVSA